MDKKMDMQTGYSVVCDEIVAIIKSNYAPKKLQKDLSAYHENDIALTLALLTKEEQQRLFRVLSSKSIAEILEYAKNNIEYFKGLGIRQKADVLSNMEGTLAIELLHQLSKEERTSILEMMNEEARKNIDLIASFDEDEIGSKMSLNYIEIKEHSKIKEAMNQLIAQAKDKDNVSVLYLTDDEGTFCGALNLKDLIIAREDTLLSDIAIYSYPYLYAETSIEDCIPFLVDYSEESIPVLNQFNHLIGVVTAQDFAEILEDELSDDYAKLGGLSAEEDLSESVFESVKKRMPWLCLLLVMGLGVSATVGLFENVVAQLPVIICFQSLILDMAGNVGTQSLAIAIRVLMDGQLDRKHKKQLVFKEGKVGLLNGAILGILSFVAIGLYLCLKGNPTLFSFAVSGCLGVAMILAMLISALSGTLIPLFFKKIKIDPAVASGPLITTVNDLVAVITYYGLAWLILLQLLKF